MDIQTRKIQFVQEFLKLTSEEVISKFEKLLKSKEIREKEEHFKPMTVEELNARIDESEKDFEKGRHISAEDLLEEIKTW